MIGAPLDLDNGGDSGSVHIFARESPGETWDFVKKIIASGGSV